MPFDLKTWREKTEQRVQALRTQIAQRSVPRLLYAGLCGAALWPLVEAVQQGDLLLGMAALGQVAAGVGGNLLAEQVQRWKDSADEGEITAWVAEEVPSNAALQETLDAILEQTQAAANTRAGLSEKDRAWFDRRLAEELERMGHSQDYQAWLEISGAVAQGPGATAVGERGVHVAGDVGGDIVTGDTRTVFDQRGQQVQEQHNVAGDYHDRRQQGSRYTVNIERAEGLAIGDGAQVLTGQPSSPATPPGADTTAVLRKQLQHLDDVALDTLCMDHFPAVYDRFARGLRRDEKINLLLDHCRRRPEAAARLVTLLGGAA
jgi:hypothetical protein